MWSNFAQILKRDAKKHNFIFLKGRYLVIGSPIDMNVGLLWGTSVNFLKSVVLHIFSKI